MNKLRLLPFLGLSAVLLVTSPFSVAAQQNPGSGSKPEIRDGSRDFDWELGNWTVHIKRLQRPLTGSTTWIELDGTVVCRKIWDGKANLAEVTVNNPTGRLEFMALRLYNPASGQWTNTFAGSGDGKLSVPMYGEFKNGRGEFYDQEEFNGRMILVRFIFISLSPDSGRSEQAFSGDGGKTWETNWINVYTRAKTDQ